MSEHFQGQVFKCFFLTVVIREVAHELQNPADHRRQRSGTGFCESGTGAAGGEQTGLWEVRMKEAQQSSRRRERREDRRAEQTVIVHLTQLQETQEEQKDRENQTSGVAPVHYFYTVWIFFFIFKRPNRIYSIIWEDPRHSHHVPIAGRQLQNQVVEGLGSWSRGSQAAKDPRL